MKDIWQTKCSDIQKNFLFRPLRLLNLRVEHILLHWVVLYLWAILLPHTVDRWAILLASTVGIYHCRAVLYCWYIPLQGCTLLLGYTTKLYFTCL